jgi:hypothetical protein
MIKDLNLQFFAEETESLVNTDSGQEGEQPSKKFTQEEVNKIISERLNKERMKHDKDTEARILEATKVAQMSADERYQHELKQREEVLRQKELELQARDLQIKATDKLIEAGLPNGFINVLDYSSEERLVEGIATLKKVFDEAVLEGVNKRLKGTPPTRIYDYTPAGGTNVTPTDPFVRGLGKR